LTKILLLLGFLVFGLSFFIPNTYANVLSMELDKQEFYVIGDIMTISGTSDISSDTIQVIIRGPPPDENSNGPLLKSLPVVSDSDLSFEKSTEIETSEFDKSGIFSVTVFSASQPVSEGITIFFDFSEDGNPISPSAYDTNLELVEIGDKTIAEETTLSFTATVTEPNVVNQTLTYSLGNSPPPGASINSETGYFTWKPTESQGYGVYTFDVVVSDGTNQDRETISVTVVEVADEPEQVPEPEPEPEPEPAVPDFVDPEKGAQYYLDRYNNEATYKSWFDKKYPDYTIEQAIELAIPDAFEEPESPTDVFDFVDTSKEPQYYIDRYNNEQSYKSWFDKSYPDSTIYEAVGVSEPQKEEPKVGICGPGTKLKDGICEPIPQSSGGACLIATAAYGSDMAPQVQMLREVRDNTLLKTESGESFMTGFNQFYYSFSPVIADWERESPIFREAVKITITPLITSLSILNYVDIDSEAEMLVYGISLILLNVGMYFVFPAIVIVKLNKLRTKK